MIKRQVFGLCLYLCFQVKQAVLAALDCGYRHIDCAAAYSNEQEVGEALALRVGPGKVRNSHLASFLDIAFDNSLLTLESQFKIHLLARSRAFNHISSSVDVIRSVVLRNCRGSVIQSFFFKTSRPCLAKLSLEVHS